ncbi:Uncharacterised protein [Mycobacteroides abscessus subsp. abscessus]|nr:Uncharacterised protein [Mycobacteroides abscessus subsp. abscessus]
MMLTRIMAMFIGIRIRPDSVAEAPITPWAYTGT